MSTDLTNSTGAVLEAPMLGITHVPGGTPLTRLSFFDGRFLRADDLELEQRYTRELVSLSNVAGGAGVVHGFSVTRETGDLLSIDTGLAINRQGRVLYLPDEVSYGIADLIAHSTSTVPSGGAPRSGGAVGVCEVVDATLATSSGESTVVWILSVGPADMRCGEEVVHGRLCEDACTTGTAYDHRIDGLVFTMTPVQLDLPTNPAFGAAHLRSRIASAYFTRERARHVHLVSGNGLRSQLWCRGAAELPAEPPLPDSHVALAVIARSGAVTRAFDMWTGRRERLEPPAMSYWQRRLNMRPLDVFLAQVLQFQCQLPSILDAGPPIGDHVIDTIRKCVDEHAADAAGGSIDEIVFLLTNALGSRRGMQPLLRTDASIGEILTPDGSLSGVVTSHDGPGGLGSGGLVDVPPAGLLPASIGQPIEPQMAALFGSGVDLRFCADRPDAMAEAFWEAKHLDRISLWAGLDDPDQRPEVDILVPDPQVKRAATRPGASAYATKVTISPGDGGALGRLQGVSRLRARGGSTRLAMAGIGEIPTSETSASTINHVRAFVMGHREDVVRIAVDEADVIRREPTTVRLIRRTAREALSGAGGASAPVFEVDFDRLRIIAGALDASVGGNPFDARVGDAMPVSFEAALAFPSERSRLHTASFAGQLTVSSVDRTARIPKVDGVISGIAHADDDEAQLSATVSLTIEHTAAAVTLVAVARTERDDMPPMRLTIVRQLGPERLTVQFEVFIDDSWATFGSGTLVDSRGVLVDGNEYHEAAETSIAAIASIVRDPQKARDLGAFILGVDGQPSTTSTMVTTRDWVMFHRRRRIDCGQPAPAPRPVEPEPPEPSPARAVVHLARLVAGSEQELARVLAVVDNGNLRLEDARPIRPIEFIAGTAAMTTPRRQVVDLFREIGAEAGGVARVVYVGQPDAQRPGRIGEFANAFEIAAGDISTIDGTPVDLGFRQPGSEQVVVLVVAPKPVEERPITQPHRVWSTFASADAVIEVARSVAEAGASFDEVRERLDLSELGAAEFLGGAIESHSLATDRPSTVAEHYVVIDDDIVELDPALVEARAGAIEPIIGRRIRSVQSVPWGAALAQPQWVVTHTVLR